MAKSRTGVVVIPDKPIRGAGAQLLAAAAADPSEFWTPERMREASPIPTPVAPTPPEPDPAPGLLAAGGFAFQSDPLPPDDDDPETVAAGSFSTTPVGDAFASFPYSAIGKLFMVFPSGTFQGSAWVIGERAIVTAGHCVFDHSNGGAASSVVFAGRYRNGQFVKKWNVISKAVPNAWKLHRDFRADLAICVLDGPVRPTLGQLGLPPNPNQFNHPTLAKYIGIGYPAVSPFNGQEMWQSVGDFADTPSPITGGTGTVRAGNNMTPGCSGGPWTGTGGQANRAFGLNSHHMPNDPNNMCTPYFGVRLEELIQWMLAHGGNDP